MGCRIHDKAWVCMGVFGRHFHLLILGHGAQRRRKMERLVKIQN